MSKAKYYKVLFFIHGPVPTPEQRAQAMLFGPTCMFRNAQFITSDLAPEDCDAVTGAVPDQYSHFPAAVPIAEWYAAQLPEAPIPAFGAGAADPFASMAARDVAPDPFKAPAAPVWSKNA